MSVSKPYCRLWRPLKGYDPLHFDLSLEEKQIFQGVTNDIMSDTTTDTTRSRLQKLEDMKNAVLQYLN
jgi:hypothetical protein